MPINPMPPAQTPLGNRPIDPQQGYGFREEPRPEYIQNLDEVIKRLQDPRNMWLGVGMPWFYHGTSALKAKNIMEKGFDAARFGEMWGTAFGPLKGRSGPGVYLAETPEKALTWTGYEQKPALLRVYVPKKNIFGVEEKLAVHARAELADEARRKGFQAVKFPDETLVMDPTSIPLRNIRPFPGPHKEERELAKDFERYLGYGD